MNYSDHPRIKQDYIILLIFFLATLVIDGIWFFLDESIPPYDQSAHLTTALQHYRIFQGFNLFSGDWWLSLWQLTPSYRAPFVYICTVPFLFFCQKLPSSQPSQLVIHGNNHIFCISFRHLSI